MGSAKLRPSSGCPLRSVSEEADIYRRRLGPVMHSMIEEHAQMLDALQGALANYHRGSARHAHRVRDIANLLGAQLSVKGAEREALSWAALLHDLGKLGVPVAMLSKTGPLTADEWVEMKRHPIIGANMISSLSPRFEQIAAGVRSHHERWDGTGYPYGRAGEEIPLAGRIIAVADVFDTITHRRPYREHALTTEEAVAELQAGRGTQFDPRVIDAFTDIYRQGRVPTSHLASTG